MIKTRWKQFTDAMPMPFAAALLTAFGLWGFVAWEQSYWWGLKEDYNFGWLVPAFVGYVLRDRWTKISEAAHACAKPHSPRAGGAAGVLLALLALGSAAFGALFFLFGAFMRAGTGASYPGTLAITLGVATMLLPLFFWNAPEAAATTRAGSWREDTRVRLVSLLLFPSLVWLVSAPMVTAVENGLSLFLLNKVTAVVFFVFDLLGLPIEQQGNVLVLPTGSVGVEDACSGIRSLTACLFAGSFLAAVFLDSLTKKILLVATAMVLAVFTNLLRSLFLTSWAYNYGPEAIEGFVHDAAGYAVLVLTVVGLLCLLPLFQMKFVFSDDDEEAESADTPPAARR